jgi:hypothetical protein
LRVLLFRPVFILLVAFVCISCKKPAADPAPGGGNGGGGGGGITPAIDPPIASSIGFFLNDWAPKTFVVPSYTDTTIPASGTFTITIDKSIIITKVPPTIFGNNTNVWMGQMVTEPGLLSHITNLKPNILRGPGGSLSDVFFFNAPKNTPPADAPSTLLNAAGTAAAAGYWFGKNTDSWTMSVDNYYNVLQQTGSQGILTMNYGYARYSTANDPVAAAAHLAADWVRFDNGRTKYWEIGNENFGDWEAGYRINTATNKDGQPEILTGDLYGRHFKVFADSMRKAAQQIGKTIYIGALLVEAAPQSWNTNTVKTWNAGVFAQAGNAPDFFIVHNYYTPYNTNATAAEILSTGTTVTQTMMNFVNLSIQNAGLEKKPIALTEWNIFSTGSKQQVSHIAGMHATIVLGELLKNKFGEATRWDLGNGWDNGNDHGLFNVGDEPDGVAKWNPRPAFYHMYFFQKFFGDRMISSSIVGTTAIETYASSFTSGEVGVVVVNKSDLSQTVSLKVNNFIPGSRFYWYTLAGGTDNGEFSRKVFVNGRAPSGASGGPDNYTTLNAYSASTQNGIRVTVPAKSVVNIVIGK